MANTIRLSAFNRRRETGIMRLVGASNFSIQLPFLLEGVIAGLLGWAVAAALLIGVKSLLLNNLQQYFSYNVGLSATDLVEVILLAMFVGVLLCGVTSFVTLRRYLRVCRRWPGRCRGALVPGQAGSRKLADRRDVAREQGSKVIARNRRARHDYTIEEVIEAGLALTGTEVKSLRAGRASLTDGFAQISDGEVWLHNVHIPEYTQGTWTNHVPRRTRKLLLHREEIDRAGQQDIGAGPDACPAVDVLQGRQSQGRARAWPWQTDIR